MKVSEKMSDFTAACLDTPFEMVCVKKRGFNTFEDVPYQFGILVNPVVDRNRLTGKDELNTMITEMNPATVRVRGHGWSGETAFVWTGTAAEFNETWEID